MSLLITSLRRRTSLYTLRNGTFLVRNLEKALIVSNLCGDCTLLVKNQCLPSKKNLIIIRKQHFSDDGKGKLVPKSSSKENSEITTSIAETVKENTKTTFYSLVILAGAGVTAFLFYVIFRELFSSKSPNSVYSKALEKCVQDTRVQDALGTPIKGFGETNRRGRRRLVSHVNYIKDNVEHMRMQFYLKGSRKSGTVYLEVIEGASGNYEYRYLFVQMEEWPNKMIVLEDNRQDRVSPASTILTPLDVDSNETTGFS